MNSDDPGVSIEEVSDQQIRVTIDGEPIHVFVERRYTTMHEHFGQFSSLDHLVEAVRRNRREHAEAQAELEQLDQDSDHEDHDGHEGHD